MRSGRSDWGLPSRVSAFGDPRINVCLPTSRGLSQAAASFIASRCQDIHRTPFLSLATPTDRRIDSRAWGSHRRLTCRTHVRTLAWSPCGNHARALARALMPPADRVNRRPHDSPKRCPTTPPTAGTAPMRGMPCQTERPTFGRGWETHASLGSSKRGGVADSLATCQACALDPITDPQRPTPNSACDATSQQPNRCPGHFCSKP
jgi:hypothetical protein